MLGKRYDQRVLVLVEVRGEQRDWDEAERVFDQRGWPVVTGFTRGEGASRGVLREAPSARLYSVEVRFFGARNRRTERAAAWRVEQLARSAGLEMYARRCELVDRDREQLTGWRAHTVDHRPPRAPAPRPRTWMARLSRAAAVSRARISERCGYRDTGMVVTGTASEARRLSRMNLPGGSAPGTAVDVRPFYGRERRHIVPRREEDGLRRAYLVVAWLLAMTFCAAVARQQSGVWVWGWTGAAALCFVGGARSAYGMFAAGGRVASLLMFGAVAGYFLVVSNGADLGDDRGWTPMQMLSIFAVTATIGGIWLLVRQWTWGEWLAWAAPLVFTAAVSFVVASGSVLHALYADSFGVTPDDLDVPGIWQAASALKLLSLLSYALFVPALWGIAKHVHAPFVSPVERLGVPLYVCTQLTVVVVCGLGALDSAREAVEDFRTAAVRKTAPPSYFGVEPEWMCVEPTVPAAKLGSRGGVLKPEHPYLSFGEAGGTVSLWDEPAGTALQMPAEQVRLVPAADGQVQCTFSYGTLPKGG
ncbi:NnrS multi-domain protein [Streptomyces sp. NBC_01591]|uniref:NnrS multi-domain protein n=1 Tax=Streptomyces sp. NBC_01591 TaxID=2975888 RepID=UPI002DD7BBBE|nr:NnrS multi-domain protein [Streptomyces sp. NBC_01591]WSD71405.1 NnrS multi-domain protein [Streptomyces sp. NBC_01591]